MMVPSFLHCYRPPESANPVSDVNRATTPKANTKAMTFKATATTPKFKARTKNVKVPQQSSTL